MSVDNVHVLLHPPSALAIPVSKINEFKNELDEIVGANSERYTLVEQADAYQRLGIAQFFYGAYIESIKNLNFSMKIRRDLLKATQNGSPNPENRSICANGSFLGLALFRIGDCKQAESVLQYTANIVKNCCYFDIAVVVFGNLAIVKLLLTKYAEAGEKARG